MKKSEIRTGAVYTAKVSNKVVKIRIMHEAAYGTGWWAMNLETGRQVRIKSAARLREEVQA